MYGYEIIKIGRELNQSERLICQFDVTNVIKFCEVYRWTHFIRMICSQHSSYLSNIQRLLEDEVITFDPAHVISLAQYHSGWKRIVVTCSIVEWWRWCSYLNFFNFHQETEICTFYVILQSGNLPTHIFRYQHEYVPQDWLFLQVLSTVVPCN